MRDLNNDLNLKDLNKLFGIETTAKRIPGSICL